MARTSANGNRNGNGGIRRRIVMRASNVARRSTMDFGKDIVAAASAYVNSPAVILSLLVVLVLAYTHTTDKAEGWIHEWAGKHAGNKLLVWLSDNFAKLLGMIAFVPTFLATPKRSYPIAVMGTVAVAIVSLPQATFYQYIVMALITHLFVHARLPSTRISAIALFIVYVIALHKMLATAPEFKTLVDSFISSGNSGSTPRVLRAADGIFKRASSP